MSGRHVGFGEAIRLAFARYFDFSGRSQRAEYWWFILFNILGTILFAVTDEILFGVEDGDGGPASALFALAVIIPGLSVGWRRLHDTGRSGLWILLPYATLIWMIAAVITLGVGDDETGAASVVIFGMLAFFASVIYVIVLLALDSDPHTNRFGRSPKYGDPDDDWDDYPDDAIS